MRDDICKLFKDLNTHYEKKISFYEQLLENSVECNFHAVSKNFSKIEDLLHAGDHITREIDLIDFEIAQAKSQICEKSGIEYHMFEHFFLTNAENKVSQHTKELLEKMKPLIHTSHENREKLIKKMQFEQTLLSSSISSLARTRALNAKFHVFNY